MTVPQMPFWDALRHESFGLSRWVKGICREVWLIPRRRPYGVDAMFMSPQLNARLAYVDHEDRPAPRRLPGRPETGNSLR